MPGLKPRGRPAEALTVTPALALGGLAWAGSLRGFFASDDVTFLRQAMGLDPVPHSPLRWLSGAFAWRILHANFALDPLPYHVLRLGLHLLAILLVFTLARRLGLDRLGAGIAATLFATAPVAFTALHWASALPELMAAVGALAACLAFLVATTRRNVWLAILGVLLWALATASKESAVLLPAALLVLTIGRDSGAGGRAARAWLLALGATAVIALAVLLARGGILGGDAYAVSFAPSHLARNLATYLAWMCHAAGAIPDRVAAVDPALWPVGAAAAIAALLLLWPAREARHRAAAFGAAWFVALLLPVLPLAHHTYAYYLYLPSAGASWFVVALARDRMSRWPARRTRIVLASLALLVVAWNLRDIRVRETLRENGLPLDPTLRAGLLLENGIAGLRAANGRTPDSVAFIAPFQHVHQDLAAPGRRTLEPPSEARVYSPFEAALRGGDAVPVFLPGVRVLGFGERILPEWEHAAVFVFTNDGQLTPLGRGLDALRASGAVMLQSERWDLAEPTFRRAIALGDTTADVAHGLLHSLAGLGREREAGVLARAFVRRWPGDPRAEPLRAWLATPR